ARSAPVPGSRRREPAPAHPLAARSHVATFPGQSRRPQEGMLPPTPTRDDTFAKLFLTPNPAASFQTCINRDVDVRGRQLHFRLASIGTLTYAAAAVTPNRPDDFSPVSPQLAAGHHFDPVWHDRGTGAIALFLSRIRGPDTVNGRFDLLVLHLTIVLDRLAESSELRAMGQALFDRFCEDMDDNLREIGVSDLSVPREMQRIGEAFYGRAQAYRGALASDGDETLVAALARNIYGDAVSEPAAPVRLAAYIREAVRGLGAQQSADLLAGKLRMADPRR